jgi:hypothetical protein
MHPNRPRYLFVLLSAVLGLVACGGRSRSASEVPESDVKAEVAAFDAVHDLVYPLWHDAFPRKDYAEIQELVPQFEPLLAAVDTVLLPGILRDKQAAWDEQKAKMMASFDGLRQAASANDRPGMLKYAEAFHMDYETLGRVVRPVVPELDAFHQELYKLYHYYLPAYDVARIREAVAAMREKMPALQAARLPARLAEKQGAFDEGVTALGEKLQALATDMDQPSRKGVREGVEQVHSAYEAVEKLFG